MQVFEIICCIFAIIKIAYAIRLHIYICIYQLLVLFVFFTPVFKCTGISYPPVLGLLFDHFRSRFSTSSAPLLLADSEELILWDRNLVVSPTGWKHKARSKRISTFNIPTYQLVQRGYLLFIKLNMSGFTAFFFTATPEISCARADSSRHVRGNGMVNLLHCDLLSQDLLRMYCHNLSKC